jgi:hypothetical protein
MCILRRGPASFAERAARCAAEHTTSFPSERWNIVVIIILGAGA